MGYGREGGRKEARGDWVAGKRRCSERESRSLWLWSGLVWSGPICLFCSALRIVSASQEQKCMHVILGPGVGDDDETWLIIDRRGRRGGPERRSSRKEIGRYMSRYFRGVLGAEVRYQV